MRCWKHGMYSIVLVEGCSISHQHPLQLASRRRMKQRQAKMLPFLTASLSDLPMGLLSDQGRSTTPCSKATQALAWGLEVWISFLNGLFHTYRRKTYRFQQLAGNIGSSNWKAGWYFINRAKTVLNFDARFINTNVEHTGAAILDDPGSRHAV